jgi:hypothetical protein
MNHRGDFSLKVEVRVQGMRKEIEEGVGKVASVNQEAKEELSMVACSHNPSIQDAEAGGLQVGSQSGLHMLYQINIKERIFLNEQKQNKTKSQGRPPLETKQDFVIPIKDLRVTFCDLG